MFLSEAPRYLMYFMSFFLLDRIETTAVNQQGTNAVTLEASEGSDIILPCSTSTKEDMVWGLFDWKKKDGTEVFMYDAGIHYNNGRPGQDERFRGRVSHFPDQLKVGNASIVIHNTKVEDSGSYRCIFPRLQPPEEKIITLVVNDPHVYKIVMEGDDVFLPCSFGAMDITNKVFDWKKQNVADDKTEVFLYESGTMYGPNREGQAEQFKGRVFHFPDQLTSGNASIQIKPTKVDDSGTYICIKADTPPTILTRVHLTVAGVLKDRTGENIPGAAKEPSVDIIMHSEDDAFLECVVRDASPKPNVTWQDNAGNILPAKEPHVIKKENGYTIVLQTTVTITDRYRCVATQKEINHQIYGKIYVHIEESCTGWIVAFAVVTIILCVVLVGLFAVLVKKGLIKLQCNKAGSQEPTSLNLDSVPDQQPLKG